MRQSHYCNDITLDCIGIASFESHDRPIAGNRLLPPRPASCYTCKRKQWGRWSCHWEGKSTRSVLGSTCLQQPCQLFPSNLSALVPIATRQHFLEQHCRSLHGDKVHSTASQHLPLPVLLPKTCSNIVTLRLSCKDHHIWH